MKHKILFSLMIFCLIISAVILIYIISAKDVKPDRVEINKIEIGCENNFSVESKYAFIVVENDGSVLFSNTQIVEMSLLERLNQAIVNRDTVLDFKREGIIVGKIIIYTGVDFSKNHALQIAAIIIPFSAVFLLLFLFYYYMKYSLYKPFVRLKDFAKDVASGNLDLSLPMDKYNLFGAFTESFDIMREELKTARQQAFLEEKSKKELIATLSHDIKTPISIVRAAGELLEISEKDEKKLINIRAILAKTLEIDALITDLFSSALEDLSQLKINVQDLPSTELKNLISGNDPLQKVVFENKIPDCLLRADPLRCSQIFGNIISNSYKYADTPIEVSFEITYDLKISFKDFGKTLKKEELPLLTSKFYRGENAETKQGAGLGLFICSKLLEQMGGSLEFALENDGFKTEVRLVLS